MKMGDHSLDIGACFDVFINFKAELTQVGKKFCLIGNINLGRVAYTISIKVERPLGSKP